MTLLLVVALQACSAFGISDDDGSILRVQLGSDTSNHINSPDDPRGMAGIEVEVTGIDGGNGRPPTLTAADFQTSSRTWETKLPDSGQVGFVVRLRDTERQLVAEAVSGVFTLRPRTTWRLDIERKPMWRDANGELRCPDWLWRCVEVWSLDIREDARNYPDEMLWVVLYRAARGGNRCSGRDCVI